MLALVIERLSTLRMTRIAPRKLVDEVVAVTRQGSPSPDVVAKLSSSSLLGTVLASGLRAVVIEPKISEAAFRNARETTGRSSVHRKEK